MNILGLDYGDVRTGVAYASTEVNIALPVKVIPSHNLLPELKHLIQEYEIEHIVLGLPTNLSSGESQQTTKVQEIGKEIQNMFSGTVEYWDERYTSQLAKRYLDKKQSIDIESARILLEEWLQIKTSV